MNIPSHQPRTDEPSALRLEGIAKSFFGVEVLKGIGFELPAGHTLGLVGENGAGKSTLMNILGGNLQPNAGSMWLNGRGYRPRNPHDARAAGVAFVHQELNLFPNLSIAENLFLTNFPSTAGMIRRRELKRRAGALLDQVGLQASPDTPLESLSTGERQLVEIAKALGIEPRVLILDEPTTSLTSRETARLFDLLGRLRERGIAMIYISHALDDVMRLCDDLVVLRDGALVASGPRGDFTVEGLITHMVGREITRLFPPRNRDAQASETSTSSSDAARNVDTSEPSNVLLDVHGVSQPGIVENIYLRVNRGEIVGLSGLMGSGRTELARILFGLDPMARGRIELAGRSIESLEPRERMNLGLAFLTESRREEGLCMEASIGDNITLTSAAKRARRPFGWLDQRGLNDDVRDMRQSVTLTATAQDAQAVKTLSGGNQQKVVLAKWLLNRPKVLILDEPTRGIDVGARHEVCLLINQLADSGAGVLMISSEIEELIGMCDRILVMSRGEIRDEINCHEFDRERIMKAALHEGHLVNTAEQGGRGE